MGLVCLKEDLARCKDIFQMEQQALAETQQWICGLQQALGELKIYEKEATARFHKTPTDAEAKQLLQDFESMRQSYAETLDQFFVKRDRHQKTLDSTSRLIKALEQTILEEETMRKEQWQQTTPLAFLWKKLRPI